MGVGLAVSNGTVQLMVVSANGLAVDVPHLDGVISVEPGMLIVDQEWRYRGCSGDDWVKLERDEGRSQRNDQHKG